MKELELLHLAALLHDIGKFRMRGTDFNKPHQEYSYEFVNNDFADFFAPCGADFKNAILHHHPEDDPTELQHLIQKQVILADRLSATEGKDEKVETAALVSILSNKRLKFTDLQEKTLREFAAVCHFRTEIHMQEEQAFFDYYKFPNIPDVYDGLIAENSNLSDGTFMLQIGWGTGYNANTVTSSFTSSEEASDDLLMNLRERFRLGKSRSQGGEYDPREFPKTRRILYQGQNPIAPLGWVKISPLEDS